MESNMHACFEIAVAANSQYEKLPDFTKKFYLKILNLNMKLESGWVPWQVIEIFHLNQIISKF